MHSLEKRIDTKQEGILIFIALACEAKALIHHFSLKRLNQKHFETYHSEENHITVVITGVGFVAMNAAIGHTFGSLGSPSHFACLNVGICGHPTLPLKTPLLIQKSQSAEFPQTHYPPFVFKTSLECSNLITFNKPQNSYPLDSAVDMEGYAFFKSTILFSASELCHSLKIVSDNPENPIEKIKPQMVQDMVHDNISKISDLIDSLLDLSKQEKERLKAPQYFDDCIEKWRFTETQKHQLHRLLRKWNATHSTPLPDPLIQMNSPKQFLQELAKLVDSDS